ncbi:MAG: hypothetical protein AB9869_32200 [Verrucomicrobiia bacterium]
MPSTSKPMPHRGPFWYAVNFSTDGETVVTGCDDRTARIWDAATASRRYSSLRCHPGILADNTAIFERVFNLLVSEG